MAWIRVFKTKSEAEEARKTLARGGIDSYITEEEPFWGAANSPRTYKLNVKTREDYYAAAKYLVKLMGKKVR